MQAHKSERSGFHSLLSVVTALFILLIVVGHFTASARSEKRTKYLPLSLILLTVDALRPDHLGCYGYPVDTSPNIDKLAKQSVLQARVFTQSISTKSSMMTLLTSLYPAVHNINDLGKKKRKLGPKIHPLPEILAKFGFRTAAFVNDKEMPVQNGFDRGYEHYNVIDPFSGDLDSPIIRHRILPLLENNFTAREPLFCLLHTDILNIPCIPPQPFLDVYTSPHNKAFVQALKAVPDFASMSTLQKEEVFWKTLDRLKEYHSSLFSSLYDGQIRFIDSGLGLLVRKIEPRHFFKEVLLVLTSHHGVLLSDPRQLTDDCFLYDSLTHVPLIIRLPNNTMRGLIKENIAELIDVMPTLLELLGTTPLNVVQGKALFQSSHQQKGDGYAYSEVTFPNLIQSSIRTNQWKYIVNRVTKSERLYHLVTDPAERDNLATQERYQAVRQQFQEMLDSKAEQNVVLGNSLHLKKKLEMSIKSH